jgi:hypothetical protein
MTLPDEILQELVDASDAWRDGRNARLERQIAGAARDWVLNALKSDGSTLLTDEQIHSYGPDIHPWETMSGKEAWDWVLGV